MATPVDHRAGHAKAGRPQSRRLLGRQKRAQAVIERSKLAAAPALLGHAAQGRAGSLEECEANVGTADVAGEDHL